MPVAAPSSQANLGKELPAPLSRVFRVGGGRPDSGIRCACRRPRTVARTQGRTLSGRPGEGHLETIQELFGHTDLATMMISTYVLDRDGKGMKNPLDD